jgi:hypothetical protein
MDSDRANLLIILKRGVLVDHNRHPRCRLWTGPSPRNLRSNEKDPQAPEEQNMC